ncbi:amino acid ABC transporter substrate-binding protein, PAAT family [Roseovarius marisflavi]|uniref:Amino acid ABC transporter substrate-binding protein, PAAT family n=1 Tax=Roseovarius marisflavi TaxID=1054996 RepID=A0A1M6WZ68_9RHOB|nr:amino acid ABC transporter substrate-binding protein [Roseovarius marisflavi]SHK99072.1 amino acid ABC transporter substrate-binding protein, PAAT family [Roseovarius marisflavi]
MNLRLKMLAAAAVTAVGFAAPAFADAGDSPTLQRIQERGVVSIGHRETSIPFSYIGENNEAVGYSIDLCLKIVEAIEEQLGGDKLEVRYVPVTGQTRIPLIANGTIDMECGSTTNNLTRQLQVEYLPTTFITGTKIASKVSSGITELEDMEGKIIGLAAGTTNEKAIKAAIESKGLDIKIVPVKDHSQGWLALETDRIDAYGSDDVLLYGLISKASDPSAYHVTGRYLSFDPYALMVQRNDSTFERLGRVTMAGLMRSGEMAEIYAKWFEPGPTKINMPLSDTLRTAFEIQALPE